MNRRHFIKQTGIIGAASMLPLSACTEAPSSAETAPASRFKMGLQLFSIHDDMMKDPIGTLKRVKAMGYQDFEIYGFDPEQVTYYGIEAGEFKQRLDELGLTVTSGHYGFSDYLNKSLDELRSFVDQCAKGAKALHSPYITWPWIAPEQRTRDNFKLMAERLNLIGAHLDMAGLGFAYHNHGYEFEDLGGESGYDIILADTSPSFVKLQMDMYWVMHSASFTPKELVEQQPGRIVMWHIKDMDKISRDYTELGNGSIDYTQIMPDPDTSGLEYYYIEQGGNFAQSPLKSAETSAEYFKANLAQLL